MVQRERRVEQEERGELCRDVVTSSLVRPALLSFNLQGFQEK